MGNEEHSVSFCAVHSSHGFGAQYGSVQAYGVDRTVYDAPFGVVVGWVIGQSVSFIFAIFGVSVFVLSVLGVVGLMKNGRSNGLVRTTCFTVHSVLLLMLNVKLCPLYGVGKVSLRHIGVAVYVSPDDAGGVWALVACFIEGEQ
jgi:hypothetical protein